MSVIRYLVIADGGTDRALEPVIEWAIRQRDPDAVVAREAFAKRQGSIAAAIARARENYDPDIVVVHRDAERESLEKRREEIGRSDRSIVRLVPVRMTEAWLLIDKKSIRRAAGNPNGTEQLDLPGIGRLERLPNPKQILFDLLVAASGFTGARRRKIFKRDLRERAVRVADFIEDFSPLRGLSAFEEFEAELADALDSLG